MINTKHIFDPSSSNNIGNDTSFISYTVTKTECHSSCMIYSHRSVPKHTAGARSRESLIYLISFNGHSNRNYNNSIMNTVNQYSITINSIMNTVLYYIQPNLYNYIETIFSFFLPNSKFAGKKHHTGPKCILAAKHFLCTEKSAAAPRCNRTAAKVSKKTLLGLLRTNLSSRFLETIVIITCECCQFKPGSFLRPLQSSSGCKPKNESKETFESFSDDPIWSWFVRAIINHCK